MVRIFAPTTIIKYVKNSCMKNDYPSKCHHSIGKIGVLKLSVYF